MSEQSKSNCHIFKKCGGCQYINLSYEEQLKKKHKDLQRLLGNFCKVDVVRGMENPYHYRNKVNAAFQRKKNGEIVAGTYESGTHFVVENPDCLIEDVKAQKIISTIKLLIKSFKITVYNEDTGYGLLRHVMVRTAHKTGQIMVVLVTASPVFPSKKNFVKALMDRHPEITTIVQNINEKKTSMVLGERNQVLAGKGFIEDVLCGRRFCLSPNSFYQVNSTQTEVLYNTAISLAGLTGKECVLDAYCGTGTIGLALSEHAKEVLGVELNKDAVRDAIVNAKRNGVKNIRFYNNDASKFMSQLAASDKKIDVVMMDPPRSGSNSVFLSSLCKLTPKRVVYISCGPESLARDLKFLTKHGYTVEKIVGVDMFPWTCHVETVVLLSQQKADDYVEVELELDELDVTSAESKATYAEIKDYVLKEHGLKVSNLYISQVKRKCGIEVGENYNLPKSEDSRQPQCPEEKEKAIKDALEHFGMV